MIHGKQIGESIQDGIDQGTENYISRMHGHALGPDRDPGYPGSSYFV